MGTTKVTQQGQHRAKTRSVRSLEWVDFSLADVQAGLGPFVAAYPASVGWQAGAIGRALTFGDLVTFLPQIPAGWFADHVSRKRAVSVAAAPMMSACVAITQAFIVCTAAWFGRVANKTGRQGLLLVGFGVLPVRAVLYTICHVRSALLAVQLLDGIANSILVIADRTQGSGRFNLMQGALATAVGLGAAQSNAVAGTLMEEAGYRTSFFFLGGVACPAFLLLYFALLEISHEITRRRA